MVSSFVKRNIAALVPEATDDAEDLSADEVKQVADLLGLTSRYFSESYELHLLTNLAAQLAKVNMEVTDPALEEASDGNAPSPADIETASDIIDTQNTTIVGRDSHSGDDLATDLKLRNAQKKAFWVALLNGTPYRWKRDAIIREYLEPEFMTQFPQFIEPGQSITALAQSVKTQSRVEIQYRLLGTTEETWFTLKIEPGYPHQVTAEYGGALETVGFGNDGQRGSVVDLGVKRGVYCATFVLTGVEGRFYDNNAPANWMNSMMEDIGNYTLRDVLLPRAHHSGMYKLHKTYGMGTRANTFTQDYSVYEQLRLGGVRVIDSRPVLGKDGNIYESHGSKLLGIYHGTTGLDHKSMIEQINAFNDEFPGELIIIDVDGLEMRGEKKFKQLSGDDVLTLVNSFKMLKHRAVLTAGQDISKLPLNELLQDGKSTVIVRMEEYRVRKLISDGRFPGAAEGFITPPELPFRKHWSNEADPMTMVADQVSHLIDGRAKGNARTLYAADFITTQKGTDLFKKSAAITKLNGPAWVLLVGAYWPYFRDQLYPNWLAMDAIRGTELKGVALAVNQCFVAKRCGKFFGRIPDAEPFQNKVTAGIADAEDTEDTEDSTPIVIDNNDVTTTDIDN